MTRSRKKTPKSGMTTAESEKEDKKIWHRKWRRKQKQHLDAGGQESIDKKEVSDPWAMGKDGKQYHPDWEKGSRK